MAEGAQDREVVFHRLTVGIFILHLMGALTAFFVLPLAIKVGFLAPLWQWTLLPLALVANSYWAILHEAIHGHLGKDSATNRRRGRSLAVFWGSSFRFLRFGHLSHHRFNRHPLDRPDRFDPDCRSPGSASLRFYAEILGGLYILEMLTPILFLLPRPLILGLLNRVFAGETETLPTLRALALQNLGSPRAIGEIRADALMAIGLIGFGFFAWGPHWPSFALFLFGRGLLVSFLDNVYHFRTPIDRPDFAFNLALPRWGQAGILNMNLHRIHHRHMSLPWWRLPARMGETGEAFDGPLWRKALAQWQGPLSEKTSA